MTTEKIDAYAHPTYGLIESPEMAQARRDRIGKNPLNKDRGATLNDELDPGAQVVGGRAKKEFLVDDDIREITVSEIDEKIHELAEADQHNPAVTKARNDLRDLKAAIVSLDRDPGLSYNGTALKRAEELELAGERDQAEVMRAAAETLLVPKQRLDENVDYSQDDHRQQQATAVGALIGEHNDRVARNKARSKAA
jgi:hypothetical protein